MKLQQSILFLLFISFLSIAATTDKALPIATTNGTETPVVYPMSTQEVHQNKMNFLQRLMFKLAVKKFKKAADTEKADRQASSALVFGFIVEYWLNNGQGTGGAESDTAVQINALLATWPIVVGIFMAADRLYWQKNLLNSDA